jgi:hypothetical protein
MHYLKRLKKQIKRWEHMSNHKQYSSKQAEERSGANINQEYIDSLLPTGGPMKTTICLDDFEQVPIKNPARFYVHVNDIRVYGIKETPEYITFYINPAGNIIVIKPDEKKTGFAVKVSQSEKGTYWRILKSGSIREALQKKGFSFPLSVPMVFDADVGGWVARLNAANLKGNGNPTTASGPPPFKNVHGTSGGK